MILSLIVTHDSYINCFFSGPRAGCIAAVVFLTCKTETWH